jgi:hypothetical protein
MLASASDDGRLAALRACLHAPRPTTQGAKGSRRTPRARLRERTPRGTMRSMESPTSRVELPECVTRLLWDTDPRRVSWETHRESILGRVLVHGDWDAIRWLRAVAGDAAVRA